MGGDRKDAIMEKSRVGKEGKVSSTKRAETYLYIFTPTLFSYAWV